MVRNCLKGRLTKNRLTNACFRLLRLSRLVLPHKPRKPRLQVKQTFSRLPLADRVLTGLKVPVVPRCGMEGYLYWGLACVLTYWDAIPTARISGVIAWYEVF
jgi:hypothetical protein